MLSSIKLIFFLLIVMFVFTSGCKNENTVAPVSNGTVSVGYFTPASTGDNTLVITEAKYIVRQLVIETDGTERDYDVNMGPFVVYMDLAQRVVLAATVSIPGGNYHEVKFQIHKLSPNESVPDPEFVQGNPPQNRFSVIAKGTYNGVGFVYKSWATFAREIEFENSPVFISDAAVINITIRLDVASWFVKDGVILDPTNPDNRPMIDQNIRDSFKRAFKDLNMDGEPD